MRSVLASLRRPGTAGLAALALAASVAATTGAPATAGRPDRTAAAHITSVKVQRGGPDATISFHRGRPGEVFLNATVSARGVSWAESNNESAVVSAYVDGHYAADIVITSAGRVARQFALGHLRAGSHELRLHYAAGRSLSKAGVARLRHIGFKTVPRTSPSYAAARYAPVLFGRAIGTVGGSGPFQNNHTDPPLVAWHEVLPVAGHPGRRLLEYSVVWSNEDGGTSTPALMAQWGRTTDIEWIYRVQINARGRRVPGTGVFQSPGHVTTAFRGKLDGTHPLLQTCTNNNNVCDSKLLHKLHQKPDAMRFALSTRDVRPAGQPREHLMDIHPWTYQVTAREMLREGKVTAPTDANNSEMGNPRRYLYVAVNHAAVPATSAGAVGLAVDVLLKNGNTYTSNHGVAQWTINRDDPAATTVKLPAGTAATDVVSISVRRVAIAPDTTTTLTVTDLNRAFFLGHSYLPGPSFASFHGSVSLTDAAPTQVIWPAT